MCELECVSVCVCETVSERKKESKKTIRYFSGSSSLLSLEMNDVRKSAGDGKGRKLIEIGVRGLCEFIGILSVAEGHGGVLTSMYSNIQRVNDKRTNQSEQERSPTETSQFIHVNNSG